MSSSEAAPLLPKQSQAGTSSSGVAATDDGLRLQLHITLEAKNPFGKKFEAFIICLIAVNVTAFMLSTDVDFAAKWQPVLDAIEIGSVAVFTLEYLARFYAIVETNSGQLYQGLAGRLKWAFTDVYSLIDLASIVPFYIDLVLPQNLPTTQFIRLARLLRMMRVEGRYLEAFTTFDDIARENKQLLIASGFMGFTTWITLSSFFHLSERNNPEMVWEHSGCRMYELQEGSVYNSGRLLVQQQQMRFQQQQQQQHHRHHQQQQEENALPYCQNRYKSILSASYYTLLNLFGEFPLISELSTVGRVIALITAVIAVAVVAIPTGILGNGFSDKSEFAVVLVVSLHAQQSFAFDAIVPDDMLVVHA
eukprot:6612-Heterococcus_DN1.PRE.2